MPRTVWLASYPKSGNTWFRVFLANLLYPALAPVNLNALPIKTPSASNRSQFDDLLGAPSALLTSAEIDRLRPAADLELNRVWDGPLLVRKTHDAYRWLPDGRPLLGQAPDFAAIYLLRDPWDVAVSMTHHFQYPLDDAVARLRDPDFTLSRSQQGLHHQIHQELSSWEGHALSWLQAPLSLCLLRYEAMRCEPLPHFRRAVRFLGLEQEDDAIAAALEASRFERLQRQEAEQRFRETPRHASCFFRQGRVGEGMESLTAAQLQPLSAMKARVEAVIAARGIES